MLLQTPQSSANETCTLDLGWETIQTHLDIRLLRYRARLAEGNNTRLMQSCIKVQADLKLNYERQCMAIMGRLEWRHPRDCTANGRSHKHFHLAIEVLKRKDKEQQMNRLADMTTTRTYYQLQDNETRLQKPEYITMNSSNNQAIRIIFSLR